MSKKITDVDIAIIGGGAAGLSAAVSAGRKAFSKQKNIRIIILEKENRVGRKLLATGNGRCNMTNTNMSTNCYNGSCVDIASAAIKRYNTDKIITFFNSLGIVCKADNQGRVYPNSEQASAVLDLFRLNTARYGIEEMCEQSAESITPKGDGFIIKTSDKYMFAKKVILTTGGAAQSKLGSDSSTYRFADMLNLKCSPIFPSLVPVKVKCDDLKFLKGIRTSAEVSLIADGRLVRSERGELQLTQNALSGICIFQLSELVNEFFKLGTVKGKCAKSICVSVDLLPDYSLAETEALLFRRKKQFAYFTLEEFFTGLLNKKIGQCLLRNLKIVPLSRTADTLSKHDICRLAEMIKSWRLTPSSISDMESAQVTAGGIVAEEINLNMQSVKYKNLYIAGEAMDLQGICGGYNLHWAFTSGIIAGENAVADLY